ncbi:Lipase maturation factor 1 [Seminavis robusta]|uniref:Lipase maturation factor 1 n=1 Tax=Seminavis robusta TaxID=568900 RepID=A0A9N8H3X3_9STRA|nr:Lipase maturation factor 1 [Seminavis robusta]|eukprot:Sro48_g028170.1 Lipase maturation factor 1 (648) ;mRNA; f:47218-49161
MRRRVLNGNGSAGSITSRARDKDETEDITSNTTARSSGPSSLVGREIVIRKDPIPRNATKNNASFQVTRWAIFRLLGFVYWVAFMSAWNQNLGLMGSDGLEPAHDYWRRFQEHLEFPTAWQGFLEAPSLFWWIPLNDLHLNGVAMVGALLSTLIWTGIHVSWLSWLLLWLLQFTLVTTARHTSFYQYGWESQLLETGFLAIFLCDLPKLQLQLVPNCRLRFHLGLFSTNDTQQANPPSPIILFLFRWLSFRISLGAGLIKIRGASCWTNKTCLYYHFETQPIPSPLSFVFHFLPKAMLSSAVDLDLFVQLYTSWMVLIIPLFGYGRNLLRAAGLVQAGFMINIILSGNFSFLNHLTIVPALACLDDACWPTWMAQRWIVPPASVTIRTTELSSSTQARQYSFPPRWIGDTCLFLLIAYLSQPVISNLLGTQGHQVMNASFDKFHLVNTYGAFGSVGQQRFEPIVSVSQNGHDWHELEFPCKPGRVTRPPCFCAPYHYRLDWNIWFLGFPPHASMLQNRERWMYRLLEKLLEPSSTKSLSSRKNDRLNQPAWWNLLDSTSVEFLRNQQSQSSLRYAKVDMYHYEMAAPLWTILQDYYENFCRSLDTTTSRNDKPKAVYWWKRTYKEPLIDSVKWDPSQNGLVWARGRT